MSKLPENFPIREVSENHIHILMKNFPYREVWENFPIGESRKGKFLYNFPIGESRKGKFLYI